MGWGDFDLAISYHCISETESFARLSRIVVLRGQFDQTNATRPVATRPGATRPVATRPVSEQPDLMSFETVELNEL